MIVIVDTYNIEHSWVHAAREYRTTIESTEGVLIDTSKVMASKPVKVQECTPIFEDVENTYFFGLIKIPDNVFKETLKGEEEVYYRNYLVSGDTVVTKRPLIEVARYGP